MTDGQWIWLASIFVVSITANTGLLKIITDDKLSHPNWISVILNIVLSLVGGYFAYSLIGYISAIIFVIFNFALFLFLMFFVKKRDTRAVLLGEKLLSQFQTIDLQICFILSEIWGNGNSDLTKTIRRTLRYILSNIQNIFGFDSSHQAQLCILIPQGFRFKVIAYEGITAVKMKRMEETFRYGNETVSLAGHAMNTRMPIIINDLSKDGDENSKYFVKLSHDETMCGSVLVYPIIRGIGSNSSEPIALLCITSIKKNVFDVEITKQILSYYSTKIEILQNCLDIVGLVKK